MSDSGNNLDLEFREAPVTEAAVGVPDVAISPDAPPSDALASLADGASPDDSDRSESDTPPHDVRAQLLLQFEQWLDGMLAEEFEPPVPAEIIAEALADTASGDPESTTIDQYTLFAALTKLSGEIGVQGRTFKQLTDALAPVGQLPSAVENLEEAQNAAARQFDRLAEQIRPADDSSLPGSKEVLTVLFDLLERLERGLKTLEAGMETISASQPRGLLARLSGARRKSAETLKTMQAMHEGYRLTVSRLNAAIDQWGIQRIGREGDSFDPATMTAIEIDKTGNKPDGTIVNVHRSGYLRHGNVLATAQVKVAKG